MLVKDTHDLAKELACRLNTTPRGDPFAINDLRPRRSKLLDESLVGYNTAVQIDFYTPMLVV